MNHWKYPRIHRLLLLLFNFMIYLNFTLFGAPAFLIILLYLFFLIFGVLIVAFPFIFLNDFAPKVLIFFDLIFRLSFHHTFLLSNLFYNSLCMLHNRLCSHFTTNVSKKGGLTAHKSKFFYFF